MAFSSRSQVARSTARSCLLAWGARRRAERRKSGRRGRAGDRHPPAARRPARRPRGWAIKDSVTALLGPIRLCSETGPVHVVVPHRSPDSYISYLELHGPIIMALRLAEQGPLAHRRALGRRESLGRAADHHAPGTPWWQHVIDHRGSCGLRCTLWSFRLRVKSRQPMSIVSSPELWCQPRGTTWVVPRCQWSRARRACLWPGRPVQRRRTPSVQRPPTHRERPGSTAQTLPSSA